MNLPEGTSPIRVTFLKPMHFEEWADALHRLSLSRRRYLGIRTRAAGTGAAAQRCGIPYFVRMLMPCKANWIPEVRVRPDCSNRGRLESTAPFFMIASIVSWPRDMHWQVSIAFDSSGWMHLV